MSQLKWKEYDRSQLERIASAIAVGYRQAHVTYDDYAQVRTILSTPRLTPVHDIPVWNRWT